MESFEVLYRHIGIPGFSIFRGLGGVEELSAKRPSSVPCSPLNPLHGALLQFRALMTSTTIVSPAPNSTAEAEEVEATGPAHKAPTAALRSGRQRGKRSLRKPAPGPPRAPARAAPGRRLPSAGEGGPRDPDRARYWDPAACGRPGTGYRGWDPAGFPSATLNASRALTLGRQSGASSDSNRPT